MPTSPTPRSASCGCSRHITDHGKTPTMRQTGQEVGMRSRASVHYRLIELEAKGAIVREPGRTRGIRLP
ncbi:LexA family protein [Streptomyces eurythermus]|uniref:LexA family protein n=1 Tax=Streptomyces eurythermus TaxID=42237 RepID=UPI0036F96E93